MWLTKIFTAVLAIVTGLLPSSCTTVKSAKVQPPAAPVARAASLPTTSKDLGELALTNHYETCINLGAGKSCTFVPTALDHSNLKLTVSIESKNAAGRTEGLSIVQTIAKSGKPLELAVGDVNYTLTPKLQGE